MTITRAVASRIWAANNASDHPGKASAARRCQLTGNHTCDAEVWMGTWRSSLPPPAWVQAMLAPLAADEALEARGLCRGPVAGEVRSKRRPNGARNAGVGWRVPRAPIWLPLRPRLLLHADSLPLTWPLAA